MTSIAVPNLMTVRSYFFEQFFTSEPFNNGFPCLEAVHTDEIFNVGIFNLLPVRPAEFVVYRAVRSHHIDYFQPLPLADVPVVRVVGRRNFQKPGRELCLLILTIRIRQNNVLICYNWDNPAYDWQPNFFPDKILCSRVPRIHRNGRIAKHSFRPGRRDRDIFGSFTFYFNRLNQRIPHIPEMSLYRFVLDLIVSQHCLCSRVPVD